MFAVVLLSLCLVGIGGHRWDNLLFKPLMDFVGEDVTPVISKSTLAELQEPDEDSLSAELGDNGSVAHNDSDDNDDEGNVAQQRKAINKKDLLQHLYTDYGYLRSVEGWTKLKDNIDFNMLKDRCFDCKRFESGLDELLNGITPDIYGHIHSLSTDGHKIALTVGKNKIISNDKKFHHLMPVSYYENFSKNLQIDTNLKDMKRAGTSPIIGCDCKVKIDLVDLGQQHYPRYLMNAVCQSNNQSPNEYPQKCWRGTHCKPLEYKVKVLTPRTILDQGHNDPALAWLPDELRQNWKFKTITVAAGCFCAY